MLKVCTGWSWLDSIDIIFLVFATYIGIYVTHKGIKGISTNKTITTFFKISYCGMIISYFVASYGFFIDLILYHFSENHQNTTSINTIQTIQYTINIITFSSYYILLVSLFSILITRLIYTFKESIYSLSQRISNTFYSISIICVMIALTGFITTDPSIAIPLQTFSILIYLITSCIMVIIFFKKLNLLILNTNGVSKIKSNSNAHMDCIQSRDVYINLINHTTKYIILTFTCFIISFAVISTSFMVHMSDNSTCVLHRVLVIWLIKINLIINILCFYLQFAFNKHDYEKFCVYFDNMLKRNIQNIKPINNTQKNNTFTANNTHTIANTNANNRSNIIVMPTPTIQSLVPLHQNIDMSLDRIDFNGNIIDARGRNRPKKYSKDTIRWSLDIGAVKEEKYNNNNPKEKHLFKKSNFASSPTLMSTQVDSQMMEDINLLLPVNTLVFEFGDVLCTQINAIHNKMSTFLPTKDKITKQMYFGGIERLDMLKQWLYSIHNNNMLCFIISNEQSKMIVNLLQDVGLLKYFVRVHPQDNKKWLSHIFGYDHRISNNVSGKRHLMLLKLLQSLQRKHDQMLYIGNDNNIIQHINSIQLCKTYLVETKGLLQSDLDEIKQIYL
eukprot:506599_1